MVSLGNDGKGTDFVGVMNY